MKNIARLFLVAAATTVSLSAQSTFTGPSSSQTPYLTPTAPGWSATSLLTVGDAIGGYLMIGIPDGLGAYSNGDGTMTVLANHEIGNDFTTGVLKGTARAHGAAGGAVSKWVINTSTWQVVSGGDFVTSRLNQMMWNGTTWAAPATAYAYLRPCSADLPALSAFYDASTSTGYNGRIFLNGEETGAEGKAFAFVATGDVNEVGKAYELPHHGKYSYENLLARSNYGSTPGAANLLQTVVVGTDDTTPGEVYVYIGAKTSTGNAIERAGLANGQLYGVKVNAGVTGYTGAVTLENASGINGTFALAPIFTNATIAAKTGAEFQAESTRLGVTQFARPEDAHWLDHDSLVFATTGATVNSVAVSSKIYQLDFNSDATNGILTTGGNISVLVNAANLVGKDGQVARSFDNLTIGDDGMLYIQEDPGNSSYVAKHWIVNPTLGTQTLREQSAVQIFESDRTRFTTGATQFQTLDEEHSGIIDITSIVNDGIAGSQWFLVATQNHAAATGANAATLVEGGQFIALNKRLGSNVSTGPGALTLTNGGSIVANGGTITDAVTLSGTGGVFDITGSTTATGAIGGAGGLWKNGAGTLTLTGANTYAGNTNVENGKLVVNGSLASSVRILKNGALGGTANIAGNLTNLGTLAPGNSPGTTTIAGNYLEAGTLDIEVWGLTPGTQHDQVVVSGTATFQAGSNLLVNKSSGGFDLGRAQSVLAVSAGAYSGAFSTLDRSTQATQVFFNNATGRIHGSGLTEAQTFADLTVAANRKIVAASLWKEGLTDATVIRANAGGSATAKAFIAAGEMGAATVAFLNAPDVNSALDALSPEAYGAEMIMSSRNALLLSRALTGAVATGDGWTAKVGYEQAQATLTASPTSLNGAYDINATYAVLAHKVAQAGTFALLVSDNRGQTTAPGFSARSKGQSYGAGFAADMGFGRLEFAVVTGDLDVDGARSGQTFADRKNRSSAVTTRLQFAPVGDLTPYVGVSRTRSDLKTFTETGAGAPPEVANQALPHTTAEVGPGYAVRPTDSMTLSVDLAYEHNLSCQGDSLTARFADAAGSTPFTVRAYGADQDLFRGGLGLGIATGEGQQLTLRYALLAGSDLKRAHQLNAAYSLRF